MSKDKMAIARAIGPIKVDKIIGPSDEAKVTYASFWQDQPCVIVLLRRFGCRLCRGAAQELSHTIPLLTRSGVRAVAIGLEPLGAEDFVQGGYWSGELYVDEGKKAYKALELRNSGLLGGLWMLGFNKQVKASVAATRGVAGNMAGDGLQLGATFVFDKGGSCLMDFRQQTFADHPTPQSIVEALGIDPALLNDGSS